MPLSLLKSHESRPIARRCYSRFLRLGTANLDTVDHSKLMANAMAKAVSVLGRDMDRYLLESFQVQQIFDQQGGLSFLISAVAVPISVDETPDGEDDPDDAD